MIEPRILEVRTKILKKNDERRANDARAVSGRGRVGYQSGIQSRNGKNNVAVGNTDAVGHGGQQGRRDCW